MCGRYSLDDYTLPALAERFGAHLAVDPATATWTPSYNVCPMTMEPIVLQDGRGRRLGLTRWGWKRPFAKNRPLINARGEDILSGKTKLFTTALRDRRCVIPAANFYEWKRDEQDRPLAPFAIRMRDQPIFAMAGLWENEREAEATVAAHLVITVPPNELMAPIHDREPLILRTQDEVDQWLDPAASPADIAALMAPVPAQTMVAWEVSKLVNSIKNKGPELVQGI